MSLQLATFEPPKEKSKKMDRKDVVGEDGKQLQKTASEGNLMAAPVEQPVTTKNIKDLIKRADKE